MSAILKLAILGIVVIGLLKAGGGDALQSFNKQIKDIFVMGKPVSATKVKDRTPEDA